MLGGALIPEFNLNGLLPPFVGATPGGPQAEASPYDCEPLEFAQRFSTSPHRRELLRGFFGFRQALRNVGIISGFQWIDGSFTEDVEAQGRRPADIDVVTLLYRPEQLWDDVQAWNQFIFEQRAGGVFDRRVMKEQFGCDAIFVDLHIQPHLVARQAAYWSGLFSHRRATFQWKGMVAMALHTDDEQAVVALEELAHD